MRILKWLQKRGTIGSVVRTVIKQYKLLKKQNPELDQTELLKIIFENRYNSTRPKPSEKTRHLLIMANPMTYESIKTLSMAIINIELDINYWDREIYENSSEIIDEEIKRLL